MKLKSYIGAVVASLLISGCGGSGDSSINEDNKYDSGERKVFNITQENQIERIERVSDTNIKLNIDSSKDVYVVVTSHFYQDISTNEYKVDPRELSDSETDLNSSSQTISPLYKKVLDFRKDAFKLLKDGENYPVKSSRLVKREVYQDESEDFCVNIDSSYNCSYYVKAISKKVITVATRYGTKTLVVWVEEDEYNNGTITQEMIDNLANRFLRENGSLDDDIYDWETNIYGEEWGVTNESNLIDSEDIIDILIYNMGDNRLAGFFWEKDVFKKDYLSSSNEKLMFYINSQLLAENDKETYTTLVHEFQHMINFYRRKVVKDIDDPTWVNEMLSEATEDLIATKIEYNGPRNVIYTDGTAGEERNDGGLSKRFAEFNNYNYVPLPTWDMYPGDYGKVSAFGAFLTRNYNGAEVLHNIFYSDKTGEEAILEATNESDFYKLLSNWATAVILSDKTNAPEGLRYNFGDFKVVRYNDIEYQLGSINFFNYIPQPTLLDSKYMTPYANFYHEVGKDLTGEVNVDVRIEQGGDIIIIAK